MVAITGKVLLIGGLAIVIIVGAILGIYFGTKHHSSSSKAEDNSATDGGSGKSSDGDSGKSSDGDSGSSDPDTPTTTKEKTLVDKLGDPKDAKYEYNFFHIADAGASSPTYPYKSSCCDVYHKVPDKNSKQYQMDKYAQVSVSALMDFTAKDSEPKFIVNGGDNFYWNGIYTDEQDMRFEDTFTSKYEGVGLKDIPWYSVLGNHDYGGEAFICGKSETKQVECESPEALTAALKEKYTLQMNPKVKVWKMAPESSVNSNANGAPNFFHMNSENVNNASVDVFHVDTGFATVHGAPETCCQCFGYASKAGEDPGKVCKHDQDSLPGGKYCAPMDHYNACVKWFDDVSENSLDSLKEALAKSKANFKVVNSHYAPQLHFSEPQIEKYYKVLKDGGVQLLIAGHTHSMFHDHVASTNTHMAVNGAGGGIQSQSAADPSPISKAKSVWKAAGNPYGFTRYSVSENWLKMEYVTFDFASQEFVASPSVSKNEIIHTYYVPITGELGVSEDK